MSDDGGWRVTAEYDDYDAAWAAHMMTFGTGARMHRFEALRDDGTPWLTSEAVELAFANDEALPLP